MNKIKESNIPLQPDTNTYIFVAQLGDQARRRAMVLFEELRRAGYRVRQAFTKDNLKQQLEEANRMGVKYCLILGQKEMLDKTVLIRDMESGIQEVVDAKKINVELEKRLGAPTNGITMLNGKMVEMPVSTDAPSDEEPKPRGRGRRSGQNGGDLFVEDNNPEKEAGLEGFGQEEDGEDGGAKNDRDDYSGFRNEY